MKRRAAAHRGCGSCPSTKMARQLSASSAGLNGLAGAEAKSASQPPANLNWLNSHFKFKLFSSTNFSSLSPTKLPNTDKKSM